MKFGTAIPMNKTMAVVFREYRLFAGIDLAEYRLIKASQKPVAADTEGIWANLYYNEKGALIYAAYDSFDDDNNALGGLLAFVGFGFYAGNIYGGVNSAHKYNRSKTSSFIDKLKVQHKLNLSVGLRNDAACLALKLVFSISNRQPGLQWFSEDCF